MIFFFKNVKMSGLMKSARHEIRTSPPFGFTRKNQNHKKNGNGNGNGRKVIRKLEFKFKFDAKSLILWLVAAFFALTLLLGFLSGSNLKNRPSQPISQSLTDIKEGKIKQVIVEDTQLILEYKDGSEKSSQKEFGQSFDQILFNSGIDPKSLNFDIRTTGVRGGWIEIVSNLAFPLLTVIFLLWVFRSARGAQDSLMGFGLSRAKVFNKDMPKVKFGDVAGVDEAKQELTEVVDFLKNPKKYRDLGARTPKGVLLVGPSGTGKTLLAKAMAGEAGVPFFSMAGSEFMEMLVGVGASRVRDLFSTAKKAAPSIIFIDEIDAIGRQRGAGLMGGHDEREQTLNQILVEMDGFQANENVIVVSATNRPDVLDPALVRPGRFDRRVILDLPDIEGRKAILAIHSKGKPLDGEIDWGKAAKRTVGFSGADLENMLNEAAIYAARFGKKTIAFSDLEEAATKVKLGPEKRRLQSDLDRKMTAYHEAGHALVTYCTPGMDPVHRISIVSRGMALGFTLVPPAADRYNDTRSRLVGQIATMMGGRAAEELIFNELTVGASSDITKATEIARQMVIQFGMSNLGPVNLGPKIDITETGRSWLEPSPVSPEMSAKVDREISQILQQAYKDAFSILEKNRSKLDLVADELMKKETIEGEEFEKLMK